MGKRWLWMKTKIAIICGAAILCSNSVPLLAEERAAAKNTDFLPKEAQELVAKASALKNYRAQFNLQAKEEAAKMVRLEGTLLFQRPNQRRLELRQDGSKEISQLLVSDGTVEWQYAPAEKKVYRLSNAPEVPGPHRPFAEGKSFQFVERIDTESETRLRFEGTPLPAIVQDSPVPIKTIRVDVGEPDGLVRELALLDAGNQVVLSQKYTAVEVNTELPEGSFTFTPPEGASVEDLTQAPEGS